jgi:hypothetical protein
MAHTAHNTPHKPYTHANTLYRTIASTNVEATLVQSTVCKEFFCLLKGKSRKYRIWHFPRTMCELNRFFKKRHHILVGTVQIADFKYKMLASGDLLDGSIRSMCIFKKTMSPIWLQKVFVTKQKQQYDLQCFVLKNYSESNVALDKRKAIYFFFPV